MRLEAASVRIRSANCFSQNPMTTLRDIPGLDPEHIGVLEEVGIETPADFVLMPADLICRAWAEGLPEGTAHPGVAEVEDLQKAVRQEHAAGPPSGRTPPRSDALPVAEVLSSRELMESGIEASAVPIARILGDPAGPEGHHDSPSPAPAAESRAPAGEPPAPVVRHRTPAQVVERGPIGKAKANPVPPPEAMHFTSTDERSREETDFERKNRGMTHKDPGRVMRGAFATLLSNLLTLVGVGTILTALFYEFVTKTQVPATLAWGLLGFPAALLVYLLVATLPRCRLCGQRLFVPRGCRKHERAHRSFLGYATTLALHVVCFRWFRCSLCGTKQKLK